MNKEPIDLTKLSWSYQGNLNDYEAFLLAAILRQSEDLTAPTAVLNDTILDTIARRYAYAVSWAGGMHQHMSRHRILKLLADMHPNNHPQGNIGWQKDYDEWANKNAHEIDRTKIRLFDITATKVPPHPGFTCSEA